MIEKIAEILALDVGSWDVARSLAKEILALIGTVKCGECLGTGHKKIGETSSPSDKQVHFTADADCPTCAGTGQRKLVVRVECSDCGGSNMLNTGDYLIVNKDCPLCIEGYITFPYPIDFSKHPELRNKTFTVEVE